MDVKRLSICMVDVVFLNYVHIPVLPELHLCLGRYIFYKNRNSGSEVELL